MACDRCSGKVGSDIARVVATMRTPNGAELTLMITVVGTTDPFQQHSAFFCPACWLYLLRVAAPDLRMPLVFDA